MTDKGRKEEIRRDRMGAPGAFPYEDIVDLPHPVSRRHKPMPLLNRAAQFAPFAALTGYHEAIEETARQAMAAGESGGISAETWYDDPAGATEGCLPDAPPADIL